MTFTILGFKKRLSLRFNIVLKIINNQKLIAFTLLTSFLALSLLPFVPLQSYDNHNHQRILQMILLLFLSVLMLVNINLSKKIKYLNIKIVRPSILFIAFGVTSSVFSNEVGFAIFYTFHITLLITVMSLTSLLSEKKFIISFIYVLVIIHTSLVLVCLLNILFTLFEQKPLNPYMIYSGFINIRFFNQVQVFILPFLVLMLKFKSCQRIIFIVLFLNLLLIFIGQARGALLSFLVISFLGLILKSRLKKQITIGLVCIACAYVTFYGLDTLNQGGADITRTTTSGRIDLWLTTLSNLTFKNILIGNGPGIFEMSVGSSGPFSHPHNLLVEILNEWGFIALTCLLFTIIYTIKESISHIRKHKQDIVTESTFYALLIGFIYSFFSGVHVMPVSQTILFIIWGLLFGRINKKNEGNAHIKNCWKIIITASFILGWCFYLYKAICIYNNINLNNGYIYGPRFWSVGQRI